MRNKRAATAAGADTHVWAEDRKQGGVVLLTQEHHVTSHMQTEGALLLHPTQEIREP